MNGSCIPSIRLFIHPFMLPTPIHYHLMHAVSLYAWSPLCRHLHRRLWAPIEAQHVWASTLWSSCDLPRLGLSAAVRWIDRRYNECRGCLMITMMIVVASITSRCISYSCMIQWYRPIIMLWLLIDKHTAILTCIQPNILTSYKQSINHTYNQAYIHTIIQPCTYKHR